MKSLLFGSSVAFASVVIVQFAIAAERETSKITPPRIAELPGNLEECRIKLEKPVYGQAERSAQFTITQLGSAEESSLPEGSPDWMMELSNCALSRLRFTPATRDGEPVKRSASLTIRFQALDGDESGTIVVDNVGPLITPPIINRSESISSCFPRSQPGALSRFVLTLTVGADGAVTDMQMPVGSESWHEKSASCVIDRMDFVPGSRDGVPVEAQVQMPIVLRTEGESPTMPALRSTSEEVEAAYRVCYPPDLLSMTSAFYSFEIATNGMLQKTKVARSSGDPRLDEVGVCILNLLEFTPLMRNDRAVRSSATWELPLRPPR